MSSSLSSIMNTGLTALRASQAGMSVASQNISNANTPGYVRAELTLSPASQLGSGGGVEISSVRRAADQFLATASYLAEAANGSATARSDLLSRAQSAFGDPTDETSLFGTLDQFWAALNELEVDPSSTLRRDDVVGSLTSTYAQLQSVGSSLQEMIGEADQRIGEAVTQAQDLINQISSLNSEIRLSKRSGADTTSAENAQSALIDKLSSLIDLRVSPVSEGGVNVRTNGGALLVGVDAATLSYTPNTAPFATHGVIAFNSQLGTQANLEPYLSGGRIAGLIDARDNDLSQLAEALGGFAAALGDALNAVHNENTSSPPVSELTGRQTGLMGTDSLNFTGKSIIGITDSSGVLAQRLTIDFDAGTITGESPAGTFNFGNTIDSFTTALDSALSAATPSGSASFGTGVLELQVGSSGGLVIQQDSPDPNVANDTATPSDRAGRGFSQFFGLNDLVRRSTPMFFENGISGSDEHDLAANGEMTFQARDSSGRFITSRTISITGSLAAAGSTWDDLVTALNATGTGLGEFGSFALNSTTGRLTFTPSNGYSVNLLSDSTSRGDTGVSASSLHGLSLASTAGRAVDTTVTPSIAGDPTLLAVGRPDIFGAIGDQLIEAGDNRGVAALLDARDSTRTFPAAGALSAQSTSLALYSSRLGGEAARLASDASRQKDGAEAVATAAADRRSQVEGVNLDDELLRMTTYQNAYAAAARLIQAASEMFDVLLSIGYR